MYDGVEKTKADFPGDGSQLAAGTSRYYRAAAEELEQGGSLSQTENGRGFFF